MTALPVWWSVFLEFCWAGAFRDVQQTALARVDAYRYKHTNREREGVCVYVYVCVYVSARERESDEEGRG
jgi:hypothetical protein